MYPRRNPEQPASKSVLCSAEDGFCVENGNISHAGTFSLSPKLPVDTAKLFVVGRVSGAPVRLYGRSTNCWDCLYLDVLAGADTVNNGTFVIPVQTNWEHNFELRVEVSRDPLQERTVLSFNKQFVDHGVYALQLTGDSSTPKESLGTIREGLRAWVPLVVAGAVYLGLAIIYFLVKMFIAAREKRQQPQYTSLLQAPAGGAGAPAATTTKPRTGGRLASLDTVRGISIGIMIFVNYGGGGYWFFSHSIWNGLTFADMVFPWFIWIMGTSMALSFKAQATRGTLFTLQGVWKIIKRCIILFWLGLFLNNGFDIPHWRIPGVLQRFAISYGVVALIALAVPEYGSGGYLRSAQRSALGGGGSIQSGGSDAGPGLFADFVPYIWQWLVSLAFLAVYLGVTFGLDVPDCGRGYLGPGGIANQGKFENCTGGAAGYVDSKIFGKNHIYDQPTCQATYHTGAYDPEGTLGYLTSVWLCFLGLQCGRTLVHYQGTRDRIVRFVIWGVFFCALATLLCKASKNDGWIPIAKNLWSPSFVFATGGTAFILLAICYYTIDVKGWWQGQPFCYVGMNSILLYMSHEILNPYFPFSYTTGTDAMNTHAGQLTENLIGATCWFVIAWRFYENKFFVNV
jgi:heparan-alpha-glucosaminide N-acetyltransferase